MAGSSSITLYRSEDATIQLQFQWREAALVRVPDLSAAPLRVLLKPYPNSAPVLTITPDAPVMGCALAVTSPLEGRASLVIPKSFWVSRGERRFTLEAFLDTPFSTQRLGENIIDLTE